MFEGLEICLAGRWGVYPLTTCGKWGGEGLLQPPTSTPAPNLLSGRVSDDADVCVCAVQRGAVSRCVARALCLGMSLLLSFWETGIVKGCICHEIED